jgi:hypothetical protein
MGSAYSYGGQTMSFTADLTVANGRVTGQVAERRCGAYPINLPVSPSGEFAGEFKFIEDTQCGTHSAKVSGRVSPDALQLVVKGLKVNLSNTLPAVR